MNVRDQFRVYFVKPAGLSGPIKIGLSGDPARRLEDFRAWSPFHLELIGCVPGNWDDEQFLHGCLANHHSHGEWFLPSPEVLAAVENVISSGGVACLRGVLSPVANLRSVKNTRSRERRAASDVVNSRSEARVL